MASRKTHEDYCCSPEGDLKPRLAPEYTVDGTVEHDILVASQIFFTERDEKLRYDLVKRLIQWMLDTDENAFFDEAEIGHSSYKFPGAFTSAKAMRSLLQTIRMDVRGGQLTGEFSALSDFLQSVEDVLPEQYARRYNSLKMSVNRLNDDPTSLLPSDLRSGIRSQRIAEWLYGDKTLD